jgi:hypothetical protein
MIDLIAAAFPGEPRRRIAGDVGGLIRGLIRRGMLARRA